MKAADLSDSAKQQVLSLLRDQFGSEQYDRMVDAYGEDALIDVLSDSVHDKIADTSSFQEKFSWKPIIIWTLIGTGGVSLWWILGTEACGGLFTVLVVIWQIVQVFGWLFEKDKVGERFGLISIIVIVAAVGYLLWIVVSWLFQSTGLWLTWFSGHF